LHEIVKKGWEPDALSGPEYERFNGGSYKYPGDIAENLKFTDR
jgi:hypothetical protein